MNHYKGYIAISSFDNFSISIYVVGYKNIGESIVVLFKDFADGKEKVVFSFVIDCYKKDSFFITKQILDNNHVEALDMVFWTHPHSDHTLGIDDIIKSYFKPELKYFKPKFYFGNLCDDLLKNESKYTTEANKNIEEFFDTNVKSEDCRRTITGEGDVTIHYPLQIVTEEGLSKDLVFYFLTPIGRLIDRYSIKGNELSRPNDLSISFVMSLDDYAFYFGGDAECDHCRGIEKDIVREMRWIKVPHHCSKGGAYISNNLGPNFDFAVSTVYTSSNLPVEDIQVNYANAGRLFMTQLKNEELNHEYGIVRFDYSFRKEDILVNIYTYGNAHEYLVNE